MTLLQNHVPLVLKCPTGLHFNPLADWTEYPCEYSSKVQCNGESVIGMYSSNEELFSNLSN